MKCNFCFVVVLCLTGYFIAAGGRIISVPENTAVLEGTPVIFKCQTDSRTQNVNWTASTSPSDMVNIYTGGMIPEHLSDVYQVNISSPGQFDLHFKATLSTAKIYQCSEGAFGSSFGSAELIVFAPGSGCNSIRKSEQDHASKTDIVELCCRVTYAGSWRLSGKWKSDKSVAGMTEVVTQTTNGNLINLTSVLSIPFLSEYNATRYIFKLNFDAASKPEEISAKNIPFYSFNWTSPMIGDIHPRDASGLVIVPQNAAVIEGETVVLKCQTNNLKQGVTWKYSSNEVDEVKIFARNRIAEHLSDAYLVNNSLPGQFDLHIKASLLTAKRYQCQEGAFGPSASAELIVLASEPQCNSIRKSEKDEGSESVIVELCCRVTYAGRWRPSGAWMRDRSNARFNEVVTQTAYENLTELFTSVLSVPFRSEVNTRRYKFTLDFDNSLKPKDSSASNIPLYSFKWTSPMIGDIPHGPSHGDSDTNRKSCDVPCTSVIIISLLALLLVIVIIVLVIKKYGTRGLGSQMRIGATQNVTPQSAELDNRTKFNVTATADELNMIDYGNISGNDRSTNFIGEGEGDYEPCLQFTKTATPQLYESLSVSK